MTSPGGRILIVDDDEDVLLAARLLLKKEAAVVETTTDPNNIPSLLSGEQYDVMLLDMNFTRDVSSGQEGYYWLKKTMEIDPSAVVIMITAYGDVDMAVRAMREGATDFVLKPWQNEKLLATVSAAMKLRQSRLEAQQLRSQQRQLSADSDQPFHNMIGTSPAIQEVFQTIRKVAGTDANVLILGENGTGKELVARALHRQSKRAERVFVSVDMGAISESLFESELFGHVKGAFTDAREDRPGRFEIASGGTLFLDEIGNLPLSLQAKLLAVLQRREVTRVGSNKTRPVDIRLICATNRQVYDMVSEGAFRQDLLYRINTVEINLPALRDREADMVLLAQHYLSLYARKYEKPVRRIDPAAIQKLQHYPWPGNVRELQHAVERAVILSESAILQSVDFPLSQREARPDAPALDQYNLEELEKMVIKKALERHGGNISKAAQELGLTRTSLYRRLEKYGF